MLLGSTNGTTTSDTTVFADRLGTVTPGYPYGTAIGSPAVNDQVDFATYTKDGSTGLEYAVNRQYGEGIARFLEVDPFSGSAFIALPGSWNHYQYAVDDHVNSNTAMTQTVYAPT